jgi:hypothetical protein
MAISRHPGAVLKERVERYGSRPGSFGVLNGDQCSNIMVQLRKALEKDKNAADYPYTKMYCDWFLHTELNNSFVVGIIERINAQVCDGCPVDVAVPRALGLAEMRQELIRLFGAYTVDDALLETSSYWLSVDIRTRWRTDELLQTFETCTGKRPLPI